MLTLGFKKLNLSRVPHQIPLCSYSLCHFRHRKAYRKCGDLRNQNLRTIQFELKIQDYKYFFTSVVSQIMIDCVKEYIKCL